MFALLRPRFGRLVPVLVGLVSGSALASTGCSATVETTSAESRRADDPGPGGSPPPASGSGAAPSASVCTPDVPGLVPAGIQPILIECPNGYTQRTSLAALPLAGRFTTARELREAFCIEETGVSAPEVDLRRPSAGIDVDFTELDVVAYAYDARSGTEPTMYQRGSELWLKLTTTACSGETPQLASVAFVVPKGSTVNEMKCSLSCR